MCSSCKSTTANARKQAAGLHGGATAVQPLPVVVQQILHRSGQLPNVLHDFQNPSLPFGAAHRLSKRTAHLLEVFGNFGSDLSQLIEPAWKVLMSSKALLPVVWELNPGHPNLLPCYYKLNEKLQMEYVRKPIYSREGANVELHTRRGTIAHLGSYGAEGFIYQAYAALPDFDGNFPVIGSWIVGDAAAGIRENTQQITTNSSRFVPHYFN